jgi:hypothetical protein
MITLSPREKLEQQTRCLSAERIGTTINRQPLGRIVAAIKRVALLFWQRKRPNAHSFIAHSEAWFGLHGYMVPDGFT